jgi:hypothetical protein
MTFNYVRRKQAGEYLQAKYGFGAEKTLAKLAVIGGGPEYRMAGRFPLYRMEDLDNWALGKIGAPVRNTSEARANREAARCRQAAAAVSTMAPAATSPVRGQASAG